MNISEFLPYVYVEAEGCPEALALNALRLSLRDFCDRSHAWRDSVAITLLADTQEYTITTDAGSELAMRGILEAEYDGAAVDVRTSEEMPVGWRTETGTGLTAIVPSRRTLLAYPIPTANDATPLNLIVALRPTLDATTCDDTLADWTEGIAAGALAILKLMPNKPWTDREAVPDLRNTAASVAGSAQITMLTGNADRVLRVRPVSFGF